MKEITVKYISEKGFEPEYKSIGASGADIKASLSHDITLKHGEIVTVPTGLYLDIPDGYEAQVRPRSGLAAKYGVTIVNAPGTIDSDYRGEIRVVMINLGNEDFIIRNGDRIAQLVFAPVTRAIFKRVEKISESIRGENGFGSTGL